MDVTLAILAGGKGVRMGAPKSGLNFGGMPILHYLLERFSWPGQTMLVTGIGNEHPAGWERFDQEVTDAVADQGPLRGVLTALQNCSTPLLTLVTVDMPEVTSAMLDHLIEHVAGHAQTMGAMYVRAIAGTRQIEPFPCVLRQSIVDAVARRLKLGNASVYGLRDEGVAMIAPQSAWAEKVWRNLNTPADLD